jgi:putative membrane protein
MMGGFGMGFMWIVLIIVVVVAVILLTKGYLRPGKINGVSSGETALEILKKRYARGEIDKPEFEEKKKGLLQREEIPTE